MVRSYERKKVATLKGDDYAAARRSETSSGDRYSVSVSTMELLRLWIASLNVDTSAQDSP